MVRIPPDSTLVNSNHQIEAKHLEKVLVLPFILHGLRHTLAHLNPLDPISVEDNTWNSSARESLFNNLLVAFLCN